MGIIDDLDAVKRKFAQPCAVAKAAADHPDITDDITAACERRDRSARAISEVLANHGVQIPMSAIGKHRRGDCQCER